MKKSLALLLILAVLSIAVMVRLNAEVSAEQDAITITEETVLGDKNAAKGLEIHSKTQDRNGNLTWATDISVDDTVSSETKFEYLPGGLGLNRAHDYNGVNVSSGDNYMIGAFGDDLLKESEGSRADYWRDSMVYIPVVDVASRTEIGQTHTEKVHIGDYFDHYLMTGVFSIGKSYNAKADDVLVDVLNENFKIPIENDTVIEITVCKDNDGKVISFESDMGDSKWDDYDAVFSSSVILDEGIYFVVGMANRGNDQLKSMPENTEIKTGYGVYCIPYHEESKKNVVGAVTILEPEKLNTAFPLDTDEIVVYITGDKNESQLFLITLKDGYYYLTVIDAKSGSMIQKIELFEYEDETEFGGLEVYDDFSVALTSRGKIAFIARRDDGFELAINSQLYVPDDAYIYFYDFRERYVFAFDGKRGAVSTRDQWFSCSGYNENCGMCLWVFDDTGLIYVGDFISSQDTNPITDRYCEPLQYILKEALALSWK